MKTLVTTRCLVEYDDRGQGLPVVYVGQIPDPFREGREIIVSGHMANGTFAGTKDSLITKCPSKFTTTTPSGRTT